MPDGELPPAQESVCKELHFAGRRSPPARTPPEALSRYPPAGRFSAMRLHVLGSSGGYPAADNPSTGFLLEHGATRLRSDAGNGPFAVLPPLTDFTQPDAPTPSPPARPARPPAAPAPRSWPSPTSGPRSTRRSPWRRPAPRPATSPSAGRDRGRSSRSAAGRARRFESSYLSFSKRNVSMS